MCHYFHPLHVLFAQIREHMVLAPLHRNSISSDHRAALDACFSLSQDQSQEGEPPSPSKLYLGSWSALRPTKRPGRGKKTMLPGNEQLQLPNARKVND